MEGFNVEGSARNRRIVAGGTVPFTGKRHAVNHGLDNPACSRTGDRWVGPQVLQVRRQIQVDGSIDVGEMNLEQNVPIFVVAAVLIEAVPPVPIASFGDVERFPCCWETRIVRVRCFEFDEGLPRLNESLPSEALLFLSGPSPEGSVDPRTGSDGVDFGQRRSLGEEF